MPGELPEYLAIRPHKHCLDLGALCRPNDKFLGPGVGLRVVLPNIVFTLGAHLVDGRVVVHRDEDGAESAVDVFRRVGEQEAHGALAGEGSSSCHIVELVPDPLVNLGHIGCGFLDVGTLGPPVIEVKLGPGGVRKEALINRAETPKRNAEDHHYHHHGDPAIVHAGPQRTAIELEDLAPVRIGSFLLLLFLEHHRAEQRHRGDREDPAQPERKQDHLEQRAAVLAS